VWWALVFGFAVSAVVQAWVPREAISGALGGSGLKPVALATGLGAASSSCSYAAISIARSLFAKGASSASALAFQFSSTNLVVELGLVIWVLIGWRFTLAEFVGGVVLIAIMTVLLRRFVPRRVEEEARAHARDDVDLDAPGAADRRTVRSRISSLQEWSQVAANFRSDWSMVWKEVLLGFLLAGFVGQLPNSFFDSLFLTGAPGGVRLLENALVGPAIAALSFVCSVGNVPLAAILWSGGIGFAGVIGFLFADLIVVPIILIYRKYYGGDYTLRIVALMFVTMVLASLLIDGAFSAAGLIPSARPSRTEVFGSVSVGFSMLLNVVGLAIFAALFLLAARGAPAERSRAADAPAPGARS